MDPRRSEEDVGSPGAGLQAVVSNLYGALNAGPPEEKFMLLTTETSLQPLVLFSCVLF